MAGLSNLRSLLVFLAQNNRQLCSSSFYISCRLGISGLSGSDGKGSLPEDAKYWENAHNTFTLFFYFSLCNHYQSLLERGHCLDGLTDSLTEEKHMFKAYQPLTQSSNSSIINLLLGASEYSREFGLQIFCQDCCHEADNISQRAAGNTA